MLCGERLQLADQLAVATERDVRLDAKLERGQANLLEPRDRGLGEALVAEVRERRAPPERERLAQPRGRVGRPAVCEQAPSLVHQPLEPPEVQLVGVEPDRVAGRVRDEHVVWKRPAQTRDGDAKGGRSALGRVPAPQLLDQQIARDHLVRMQEKQGEQRALLRSAQRDLGGLRPTPRAFRGSETPPGSSRPRTLPAVTALLQPGNRPARSSGR